MLDRCGIDRSSSYVDFEANATTCALQVEGLMPLPVTLGTLPLALAASLGHTSFHDGERDALGFTSFFEAGLALETDISTYDLRVKKLRLGTKAIAGEDVAGWSLILGYRF